MSTNTVRVNVADMRALGATMIKVSDLLHATRTLLPPDAAQNAALVAARGLMAASLRRMMVLVETRGAIEPR